MLKKKHAGHIPMTGVKYKFTKVNSSIRFYLKFGVDIQKQLKIKAGNRILLTFDKKNPFKILISKTKTKEPNSYVILQAKAAKSLHIAATWKFKKPKVAAFKESQTALIKTRKNGMLIELTNGGKKK